MVEKRIRGAVSLSLFIDTQKLITNAWKIMIKKKESLYLQYSDINNFYSWTMSQKHPVYSFEWIEDTSQFNKNKIKI